MVRRERVESLESNDCRGCRQWEMGVEAGVRLRAATEGSERKGVDETRRETIRFWDAVENRRDFVERRRGAECSGMERAGGECGGSAEE